MIRKLTLPSQRQMPVLGQGTWRMGEDRAKRRAEVNALRAGFDLGLTLVDTAEMYADGGAEEARADALAPPRVVDDEARDLRRARLLEDARVADLDPACQTCGRLRDQERVIAVAGDVGELDGGHVRCHRVTELRREASELRGVLRARGPDPEHRALTQGA